MPQGSILGPLLFSIYTNDLASIPQKCSTQSYVDDTKLVTSFQLKDNLDAITDLKDNLFKIGVCNLVPRVSHLTAPWSERGETLAHGGHVSPRFWETTVKLLKGWVAQ